MAPTVTMNRPPVGAPRGCPLADPVEELTARGVRRLSALMAAGNPLREVWVEFRTLYAQVELTRMRRDLAVDVEESSPALARAERPLGHVLVLSRASFAPRREALITSGAELW